jgi:hypothetical protein
MTKPTPETRETIEAELRMSERERAVEKARSMIQELDEFESRLQLLEKEAGLPVFYRSKPLTERMAHLGMSQESIANVASLLDAIKKLTLGRGDELPAAVKNMLAEEADAELSAADQLATILASRQPRAGGDVG